MPRLIVHVEGPTEEMFVNEILAPHLYSSGFYHVRPVFLGNPRQRGGVPSWPSARRDIVRHLQQDATVISTTMVDFYGMPRDGDRAWPGRAEAATLPTTAAKSNHVVSSMLIDLADTMGGAPYPQRFFPFVAMHEFEALLFSNCAALATVLLHPGLRQSLQEIRDAFLTPEDIDDSPITAPSKRLTALMPAYQKPLYGNLAALEIGLAAIRECCPLFNAWITQLESLA